MTSAPSGGGAQPDAAGRPPLVAGNWKMHTTVEAGVALARDVAARTADCAGVEVAVLPPFTHLWPVHEALRGSAVLVGAQDVYWEDAGAFTGEISPPMLAGWCDLVLVGHSERRHVFGERDDEVGRKFGAALEHALRVIVAVGETEAERDAGETFSVVGRQLEAAFAPLGAMPPTPAFAVAYEPVWAIGTGRTATPEQAQEVAAHVRSLLAARGLGGARVLYGGSVTSANARSLFAQPDIDGALVGGASLRAEEFAAIVIAATGSGQAG